MAEEQSKKANGLTVVITSVAALVMGIGMLFLPMQGQITALSEEVKKVEERSAGRRVDMDRLLQTEIREAKGVAHADVRSTDDKLQLEMTALREVMDLRVEQIKKLERAFHMLMEYHRNPTNAEKGKR